MRSALRLLVLFVFTLAPLAAAASPIAVTGTLSMRVRGIAETVVVSGAGTVDVGVGGSIQIPAGFFAGTPAVVPVTSVTAINALSLAATNLSGTFSLGGATSQAPGELCPPGVNEACVVGGGLGGVMGLQGFLNIVIVPSAVTFPINLNLARMGQGGGTSSGFIFEGAPWTTGTASLYFQYFGNTGTSTTQGSNAGNTIVLVTTTYVSGGANLLPVFSRLTLTGVPEPGAALLLALGGVGLVVLRRPRR